MSGNIKSDDYEIEKTSYGLKIRYQCIFNVPMRKKQKKSYE